ncbi:AT-rich interactive domain-containing protein 5 isoform X2 [Diospyros lotus]|uniref:AT-rich interactive domain-containing protein 5 isoform X2 n=1 Tax=Diospyros lotus TaxID=55363 RepID=UPI002258230D|nr:AT-rich interactive domain-containing protein 5 isoform X2 [Diospyros lotus]
MEDSGKRGQESAADGQVSEINLVDANVDRQEEEEELPAEAVAENQNPPDERSEEKNTPDKEPDDQNPNENSTEDQNLNDGKEAPVPESHQSEKKERLLNLPTEPDVPTPAAVTEAGEGLNGSPENKDVGHDTGPGGQHEPVTPNTISNVKAEDNNEDNSRDTSNNWLSVSQMEEDDECGSPEEQAAFMKELESFYREKALEFKAPRFYGQPLNCLKLWRAVIKLGGYDRVTGSKLWRQVGESFHPPKTCTTVSWTFRIFYEKALLEYERHKTQSGDLQLAVAAIPEPSNAENEANGYQAPGSGRARRDAAARAMQGWHVQRLFGYGEVGEPIIKDKNLNNMPKREKSLKSIAVSGSLKQKRPTEVEHPVKAARTETAKQVVTTIVDIGPPADWVKINVLENDCFEVYALVPGLLREEVRVQSDPAGRLVITGQPEQPDNPWGITAFKKVVNLPARIDPLQTSAVVSLHGRLFVRVPFEQSNI